MKFWSSTSYSDFPTDQTLHKYYGIDAELGFNWIRRGFHRPFAMGLTCQMNAYLSPRGDAGGLSREYVLRVPSVS